MIFTLALIGFFLFTMIFFLVAGAIIYHINAYTLPGWTMGRTSIIVFCILAAILFLSAAYSFYQVPWEEFEKAVYEPKY